MTGILIWLFAQSGLLLVAFGLLFGALALPCYSLAAAHAYDKTLLSDMVPTAATILLANAVGAVIGPLLASLVMAELGPRSLFLFTAVVQAALAGLCVLSHQGAGGADRAGEDRIRSGFDRAGRRRDDRRDARPDGSVGGGAGALSAAGGGSGSRYAGRGSAAGRWKRRRRRDRRPTSRCKEFKREDEQCRRPIGW